MSWRFSCGMRARSSSGGTRNTASREACSIPAGTLGGCTAQRDDLISLNSDWDAIADETGDETWRAQHMRRYFEAVESCQYRPLRRWMKRTLGWDPSRHGFEGPRSGRRRDTILRLYGRSPGRFGKHNSRFRGKPACDRAFHLRIDGAADAAG